MQRACIITQKLTLNKRESLSNLNLNAHTHRTHTNYNRVIYDTHTYRIDSSIVNKHNSRKYTGYCFSRRIVLHIPYKICYNNVHNSIAKNASIMFRESVHMYYNNNNSYLKSNIQKSSIYIQMSSIYIQVQI